MKQASLMLMGLVAVTLVLVAACGGGEAPTVPTTAPADTAPPTPATGGEAPGGEPPHAFVGSVTVDGALAADGTVVTAHVGGAQEPAAETTVSGGRYDLKIVQRGDASYGNKKVIFKIGGKDANETTTWERGGADELNLVVGAAGAPPAGGADLVAQGQAIFSGKGGCLACHAIEGLTAGLLGPDLTHIGTEAAGRQPGLSAREYIDESIRAPQAFVPSGVERAVPDIMTDALVAAVTDADREALVEFLLAQK